MTHVGRLLQLDDLTWSTVSFQQLRGRVLTVLFAYGIMAWNRFGLLVFVAPRAAVRLMLVGVYSWLGLAIAVWLAGRRRPTGAVTFRDATLATAIVHVPLVALGFFVAIVAGFGRILGPGAVLAVVVVVLWMPTVLTRAFTQVAGLKLRHAIPAAVALQLAWIVGPGLVLHRQVGHLL